MFSQLSQFIKLSFQISFEMFNCFLNCLFNLVSLILRESRSQWEVSQVTTHSNPCTSNKDCIFRWEGRAIQFGNIHIRNMFVSFFVTMIILNERVKEGSPFLVRISGACINSNTWVCVLTAWEDCMFKWIAWIILLIFKLIPNFSCQIFWEKRFSAWREGGEPSQISRRFQSVTAQYIRGIWFWFLRWNILLWTLILLHLVLFWLC